MAIVRCSMVMSPNGYIARTDGDEEWINEVNWQEFIASAEQVNNFIAGRETFEQVMQNYGDDNFDAIRAEHKVIVTRDKEFHAPPGYTITYSPREAVDYLVRKGVEEILLAGGGKLNATFAQADLIDELELIIEPHVIGEGRPVLGAGAYDLRLSLKDVRQLSEDRVRLLYAVVK